MSSTLQLMPTATRDITQLDPKTLASIPEVTYDLKRLKVYSSCLRCRAKKVKCDRKEPCSRCEKHKVECSYRELASVQLDIRQFQKHLTNPKIRKDGAGIITSTATPIIRLPSGDTAVLSPSTTAAATLIAAARASALCSSAGDSASGGSNGKGNCRKIQTKRFSKTFSTSTPASPVETAAASRFATEGSSSSSTDTESDTGTGSESGKSYAMARASVRKVHRQRRDAEIAKRESIEYRIQTQAQADAVTDDDSDDEEEEIERLVLRDGGDSGRYSRQSDVRMLSESEEDGHSYANVPIWRAQAIGKHTQTAHEQDMAETFGLAAYLKATETDSGAAGQTVAYDLELERALAQRMPTSFSRPDRSVTRARKYAQAGYNPALPYARPAHCQLSASSTPAAAPVAAHCCCQIAAKHGQAPGTCYFSGGGGAGRRMSVEDSSMSPPPQTIGYEQGQGPRITYSPSYQPSYTPREKPPGAPAKVDWSSSASSMMPPPLLAPIRKLDIESSSASTSPLLSPRIELPPIYLPKLPALATTPSSSDLSRFQVGREGDKPLEIACKYNEPNVDAWDMIERPLSRTVPVTTKRGRSVKMEMGWLLS